MDTYLILIPKQVLRITLTAKEQAELEHTFKTIPDRRLRDRRQAV
jgi:hypothetical protein